MADDANTVDVANSYITSLPSIPVGAKLISNRRYQYMIPTDSDGVPYSTSNPLPSGPPMVTFVVTRPSIPDNASTQVIAANASRRPGSYLVNNTDGTFFINYDAAAVLNQGAYIAPGAIFLFNSTQEIRAIQNSGGALNLDVFEAT